MPAPWIVAFVEPGDALSEAFALNRNSIVNVHLSQTLMFGGENASRLRLLWL